MLLHGEGQVRRPVQLLHVGGRGGRGHPWRRGILPRIAMQEERADSVLAQCKEEEGGMVAPAERERERRREGDRLTEKERDER